MEGIKHRFHFMGYYENHYELLRLLDVFGLTSLDEGLPMALLEVLAKKYLARVMSRRLYIDTMGGAAAPPAALGDKRIYACIY